MEITMEDEVDHVHRPGSGEVTWGMEEGIEEVVEEEGTGSTQSMLRKGLDSPDQPTIEYRPQRWSKEDDEDDLSKKRGSSSKSRSSSKKSSLKSRNSSKKSRSSSKKKQKDSETVAIIPEIAPHLLSSETIPETSKEIDPEIRKEIDPEIRKEIDPEISKEIDPEKPPLKRLAPRKTKSSMSGLGRCLYGLIIFVATISLVFTAIIHIFAWYENDIEQLASLNPDKIDWFDKPRADKWNETTCIMMTWWTFWIWIAMFFLQLVWIFYGMVLTCRRTKEGYLYESAATMPCTLYLTFLFGLGATAAWNVFWGESGVITSEMAKWGAIVIGGAALFYHITLAIGVRAFIASIHDLVSLGKKYDLVWNQLFTHNGLAAIATWCTVITMYAITSVLGERDFMGNVNFECAIGLGLIMLYMLIWFLFDLFFTKKALYYIFTPYVVALLTFVSALVRNTENFEGKVTENLSFILSACFLSVTALFLVIKVITVIVRGRYYTSEKDEVRSLHDDNVYVMQ